jgi:hypothetical protein
MRTDPRQVPFFKPARASSRYGTLRTSSAPKFIGGSGLSGEFDVAQLIELIFLVGSYSCLAMVFNSAGVRLEPGVSPAPFPESTAADRPD